ncbi:alpha/beta hydrolase [uncultured Paraglaciecola sp.]|uniref:alpha/beta fold hydrolase n=1 Tax=uncultured Paraglaciecola sp. TaxID=1765024 RepID=UPI0030D79EC6|tara:strand:+ start:131051 stop:132061 length:1011 start_codon:yes stop_codon:yes gene_type:complete
MSLLIVVASLLTACERGRFNDDLTKVYGLPDKSSEYHDLIKRAPESLSQDELYSRVLTLWETPYRELKLPTSNGTTHIIVSGPADGETLVLLHGMNADSTMWYPNVKALSASHRVYAIDDILGPGKSKPNHDTDSLEFVISWYFEVFDALKLEKINLVGASQGGWIATNLALAKPEKINKLILLSPAQTLTWLDPSVDIISNLIYAFNPQREGLRNNLATLSSNVDGIQQMYIDQFFRTISTADTSPLLMDMQPFNDEQLSTLTMPVLFLAGDNDLFNGQDSVDRAIKIIPCIQAEIIQGSGHFISVDQAKVVNRKIEDFVATKQNLKMSECKNTI